MKTTNVDPKLKKIYNLCHRYKITVGRYNQMRKDQDYCCKVCGKHESQNQHKTLAVDHCHQTKTVRGLLCNHCNLAAGYLQHNPDLANKLAKYLLAE